MECVACHAEKLSVEFPELLSQDCDHAPRVCVACALAHAAACGGPARAECPECGQRINSDVFARLEESQQALCCPVFQDLAQVKALEAKRLANLPASGSVEVVLLDGRRCSLQLSQDTTLRDVAAMVKGKLGVDTVKQRLLHRGRELQGAPETLWRQLRVPFDSVLQLVVVMCELQGGSQALRELTFDLSWVFRGGKILHLNGSCLVLGAFGSHLASVDFRHQHFASIRHHGPSSRFNAAQKISVNLGTLPDSVMYLFFVLSANGYAGIYLSMFESPSVKLREAHTQLASYTATNTAGGEALMLCWAKKDSATGAWRVAELGRACAGNARDYDPLLRAARSIIGHE